MKGAVKRKKNNLPLKFDREGFYLSFGIGILCVGIGVLIIWGTITAPEGGSQSTGFTTAQRIARVLPRSWQEWLAFIFAGLMVLFGVALLLLGVKQVVQFIISKMKKKES